MICSRYSTKIPPCPSGDPYFRILWGLPGPLASGPHLRFGGPVANNQVAISLYTGTDYGKFSGVCILRM